MPGVNTQDPRVQSIRRCRLTNVARMALSEALRQGYLYVQLTLYEPQVAHNLRTLWGWWCAAAGHPEIIMSAARSSDAVHLRCDLAPTDRSWGFDAWQMIVRMLVHCTSSTAPAGASRRTSGSMAGWRWRRR